MTPSRLPLLLAAALSAAALLASNVGCSNVDYLMGTSSSIEDDTRHLEDPIFPDERRAGIIGIQKKDELFSEDYRVRLRFLAEKDEAPEVRAQALRALNQSRDPIAVPLFVKGLSDPSPQVRLEAAKALRHFPTEPAVTPLTRLATDIDETRDIRYWATTALGYYPRLEVARTLVPLLSAKDFGVSYAARESLRRLTGKDYHYDESLWFTYLTTDPKPFRTLPAPLAK